MESGTKRDARTELEGRTRSRRQLLKRGAVLAGAGVSSAAGGLLVSSPAASLDNPICHHLDADAVADPFGALRELLRSLENVYSPTRSVVITVDGAGEYPIRNGLIIRGRNDVQILFDPRARFTLVEDVTTFFSYLREPHAVVQGLHLDVNNHLVARPYIGSTFPVTAGALSVGGGGTFVNCTFLNTGGENHPSVTGAVGFQNVERVIGCTFDRFYRCVREADEVRDCDFSNLLDSASEAGGPPDPVAGPLGGSFTLQVTQVIGNRTTPGQPSILPGEIGGTIVSYTPQLLNVPDGQYEVDPDAPGLRRNVVVEGNHIYSPAGAFKGNTGVSGDVIALKAVADFSVQRNVVDGGGEFGIVISHGSNNGVVAQNIIRGTDGGGLVVGAQNAVTASGRQASPRIGNIDVFDNMIVDVGLDAANERRGGAQGYRTTVANYPNAIAGIRVWNASDIRLARNVVNQYRSSGIWIKDSFPAPTVEGQGTEQQLNEVRGISLASDNVFVPYRAAGAVPFNEGTSPADRLNADLEPWGGLSWLPSLDGQKTTEFVGGLEASQIVSRTPIDTPRIGGTALEPVVVTTSCLAGRGRIDTRIVNAGSETADYAVTVAGLSPRMVTIEAGRSQRVSVTGRPVGRDYVVTVDRDGERIAERTVRVDC